MNMQKKKPTMAQLAGQWSHIDTGGLCYTEARVWYLWYEGLDPFDSMFAAFCFGLAY